MLFRATLSLAQSTRCGAATCAMRLGASARYRLERDFIGAARLHGEAALGLSDLSTASERLHHALIRARAVNFVEEELPALTALAELRRRQQYYATARELLN